MDCILLTSFGSWNPFVPKPGPFRGPFRPICCSNDTDLAAESAVVGELAVFELQAEQRFLRVEAAAEAGQVAAGADHPVAGDDDRNRVSAIGGTDRADRFRAADPLGDVAVGAGRAVGDLLQLLEHAQIIASRF